MYHSMMLKYLPKREHFSYNGMIARTQLAAIDNNENAGRGQAVILKGNNAGEARYRRCFPKSSQALGGEAHYATEDLQFFARTSKRCPEEM